MSAAVTLAASLVALALVPLLSRLTVGRPRWLTGWDGLVTIAVAGLVVVDVVPGALDVAGPWALVPFFAGLVAPSVLERGLSASTRLTHAIALAAAVAGVGVHASLDGAALAMPGGSAHGLPLAIVLHRTVEGAAIWWLVRVRSSERLAWIALGLVAAVTVVGFVVADAGAVPLGGPWAVGVQAVVGGLLLHVLVHPSVGERPAGTGLGRASGWGSLAGVGVVAGVVASGDPGPVALRMGWAILGLARDSAPALLFAFALAGVVKVVVPAASLRWLGGGASLGRALRGVAFGLPLPLCTCGVVPVYRSLVQRGVPVAAAMAFLVATPELSLDAVLLSWPLLGPGLTVARVVSAVLVAVIVGWWLGGWADRTSKAVPPDEVVVPPAPASLFASLRSSFAEVVDEVMPWLALGLALAALIDPLLDPQWVAATPTPVQVLVLALVGLPAYVCASAATPMVAALLGKGVSAGAGLAFLLTGPATNVTTFGVLAKLHGRGVALAFAGLVTFLAVGLGLGVDAALPAALVAVPPRTEDRLPWLSDLALCALVALGLMSLLRRGPTAVLEPLRHLVGDGEEHRHPALHDHAGPHQHP